MKPDWMRPKGFYWVQFADVWTVGQTDGDGYWWLIGHYRGVHAQDLNQIGAKIRRRKALKETR